MKTSAISKQSEKTTNSRKIEELISIHGDLFRHPFENGRIPEKSIGNFFGRAAPRQRAILKEMQSGKSYSKAYELSSSEFDTKRWDKVFVRTAAVRGHILQSLVRVYQDERDGKHGNACERDVIRELLTEIISVATRLALGSILSSQGLFYVHMANLSQVLEIAGCKYSRGIFNFLPRSQGSDSNRTTFAGGLRRHGNKRGSVPLQKELLSQLLVRFIREPGGVIDLIIKCVLNTHLIDAGCLYFLSRNRPLVSIPRMSLSWE